MALRVIPDTSFMTRAACRGRPDIMFPDDTVKHMELRAAYTRAVTICEGCPVLAECREWAINDHHGITGGIIGGMRPDELRQARSGTKIDRWENHVPKCGTTTAYNRHLDRGEQCQMCCDRNSRKMAYA